MGHLRKRVGLIHELWKLRGTKKFPHSCSRRLCVNKVLRHHGIDFDRAHAFLNGTLHAQEAKTILIFHQLANRAHPAVAQMVNIINLTNTITKIVQGLHHRNNIFAAQNPYGVFCVQIQTHIHLNTANRRQVIALGIKEKTFQKLTSRFQCWWFARTHYPVYVDQRLFFAVGLIGSKRVAHVWTLIDMVNIEKGNFFHFMIHKHSQCLRGHLVTGLHQHQAIIFIN